MLKGVRERLARLYAKNGEFERAAEYLGMLRQVAGSAEEKEAILAELLDVYLRAPNVEAASQLINNCLLEKDLGPNNVVVLSIENYFSEPPATSDPREILEALTQIKTSETRPMWAEQLQRWGKRVGQAQDSSKSREGSN
jgi:hypothetical protein